MTRELHLGARSQAEMPVTSTHDASAPELPGERHKQAVGDERPFMQAPNEVELAISELMFDNNGETVLFNDSNLRAIALESASPPVSQGRASTHVTAAGADVTGFRFVSFDDGHTIYVEPPLEVIIKQDATPG